VSDPPEFDAARNWLARARELGSSQAQQTAERGALPLEFRPLLDLTDPEARRDAFWRASAEGDSGLIADMADRALLESRDEFGRGALSRAASAGRADAVAQLLQRGANASDSDSQGVTPLMLASASGNGEAVLALLRAGAKANTSDHTGNTPLMYAARADATEGIKQLLAGGADLNLRNQQDWSALDFARSSGQPAAERLLKERPSRSETCMPDGPTSR
jgi:ankyrin repeat protein